MRMLSREGVGGCEAVWAGFCEGYPHRTWYGLHVLDVAEKCRALAGGLSGSPEIRKTSEVCRI
jgi:hypothetical protein